MKYLVALSLLVVSVAIVAIVDVLATPTEEQQDAYNEVQKTNCANKGEGAYNDCFNKEKGKFDYKGATVLEECQTSGKAVCGAVNKDNLTILTCLLERIEKQVKDKNIKLDDAIAKSKKIVDGCAKKVKKSS